MANKKKGWKMNDDKDGLVVLLMVASLVFGLTFGYLFGSKFDHEAWIERVTKTDKTHEWKIDENGKRTIEVKK